MFYGYQKRLYKFLNQTSQMHKLLVIKSTVWKEISVITLTIILSFIRDDINAIGCQERKMMIVKPLSCRRPNFHRLFWHLIFFHLYQV